MNYRLEMSRQAARYFARLDERTRERVSEMLAQIVLDPFGVSSKPLAGYPGRRSARVGPLRILFSVLPDTAAVRVQGIGPRGQVYRELGR